MQPLNSFFKPKVAVTIDTGRASLDARPLVELARVYQMIVATLTKPNRIPGTLAQATFHSLGLFV